MSRILLVEDEPNIARPLAEYLEIEGYDVAWVETGEEALERHAEGNMNLILLDVMLPGLDGFAVCRRIRSTDPRVPILFLTARGEESDKVLGLEGGADDYVTKPFSLVELQARIRAHLRRIRRVERADRGSEETIRIGPWRLHRAEQVLEGESERIELTTMEWELLDFLVSHPGEVLSRQRILNEVWGFDRYPTTRTVDTHVYKLRQKLEPNPENPVYIRTVHGRGYRFERNVTED